MNVVLISIDSLRQDRLGIYGHRPEFAPEIPVSPHIDALAAEGVTFDSAWSTTSWTLPAHASLFTALSDRGHQVENDAFSLDPLLRTLTQEFDDDGYVTGRRLQRSLSGPSSFGFGPWLRPVRVRHDERRMSWPRSFEENHPEPKAPAAGFQTTPPGDSSNFRDQVSHWDVTSPRINAFAKRFLDEHARWQTSPSSSSFTTSTRTTTICPIPWSRVSAGSSTLTTPAVSRPKDGGSTRTSGSQARRARARSASVIWPTSWPCMTPRSIGLIDTSGACCNGSKTKGLAENTIVCVLSDHGDEFFEHGGIGHRSTLFTELTEIPLILKVPGQDAGRSAGGRRLSGSTTSRPRCSTTPVWVDSRSLEGRSLRSLIEGPEWPGVGQACCIASSGGPFHRDAWRNENGTRVQRVFEIDHRRGPAFDGA